MSLTLGGIADFSVLASQTAKQVFSLEIDPNRIHLFQQNMSLNNTQNINLITSKMTSIDQIFSTVGITHCDFLKIDCEGCEYELVLNTSPITLKHITNIAAEIHSFDKKMRRLADKLINKLTKAGYSVHLEKNPVYTDIKFLFACQK